MLSEKQSQRRTHLRSCSDETALRETLREIRVLDAACIRSSTPTLLTSGQPATDSARRLCISRRAALRPLLLTPGAPTGLWCCLVTANPPCSRD